MGIRKPRQIVEFGDFQTPDELAREVVSLVSKLEPEAGTIVEPSCGRGAFLVAAQRQFPQARLFGLEINEEHLAVAEERLAGDARASLRHASFFFHNWSATIASLTGPLLILGNPPWVTNADLGGFRSGNLPPKENFKGLSGFDALTGKSNFDISEWMLLQNIEWLRAKQGSIAVLCKSAVARKVLAAAFKSAAPISDARIYKIDAMEHFGASVDAALLYARVDDRRPVQQCAVYDSLRSPSPVRSIGFVKGMLLSDSVKFERQKDMLGANPSYTWRSGLKHDCSKVMELARTEDGLKNGYGDLVEAEEDFLFPLFKSSDIANGTSQPRKVVFVTQRVIGDETSTIRDHAPRTWQYLYSHRAALDGRTSVIYRNKPMFSIFGIGAYSFAPWKVAISGLYKKLAFRIVAPHDGKPTMVDDTVYFLPFETREEAENVLTILESELVAEFFESMIFWDEKRPITVELLRRLDLDRAAKKLGHALVSANRDVEAGLPLFA